MPTITTIRRREGKYWGERFRLLEEAKQQDIDKYYKQIETQFNKSIDIIDKKISDFYRRLADEEHVSLSEAEKLLDKAELKGFKMSLEDYIEYGKANAEHFDKQVAQELERASIRYRVTRLEATKYQLKAEAAKLYSETDQLTYKALAETYQEQYSRTAFEIFKGTGIGIDFSIPDWDAIDSIIREPWRADGLSFMQRSGGYRKEIMASLEDELSRMIINGEGYAQAASRMKHLFVTDTGKGGALYKAKRLIYTEGAFFQGNSQFNCYKDLGVERYEFMSELNTRVCENCGLLDGKVFRVKDRRIGVNAPPMHPFCRCVICPYFDDRNIPGYVEERRSGRDKEGKSVLFPADYTYQDWKKNIATNEGTWTAPERWAFQLGKKAVKAAKKVYQTAIDQIRMGGIESAYPKKHINNMIKIMEEAPDNAKRAWNRVCDFFRAMNPKYRGKKAYYSPSADAVLLDMVKASKGSDYQTPYQTPFHEYGHFMDYIANRLFGTGDHYKSFTETYKNGIFGQTLKDEASQAVENYFLDNIDKYTDLSPESVTKMFSGRSLLETAARNYKNGKIGRKDLLGNREIVKALIDANPQVYTDFCDAISDELTLMQRSDISDMFEPIMPAKDDYPFGVGHGFDYWYNRDNGKEGFAEMFSALVCNPESLEQIQRFFPKSYEIFLEMLEVID